jgi:hypothetical protein
MLNRQHHRCSDENGEEWLSAYESYLIAFAAQCGITIEFYSES